MSLLFLCNTAGNVCDNITNAGSGSTATGYSRLDAIAGPRSTWHRGAAASGGVGLAYTFASNYDMNYAVIARADKLLTQNTSRVRLLERDGSNVWGYISGIDYNPLTSASLVGIKSQDLVFSFTQVEKRGIQVYSNPLASTDAQMLSKFYVSNSFEFTGFAPSLGAAQEELPIGEYFTPPNGHIPYEVELRFTLTFSMVDRTTITLFKALPQIRNWPLFLYDTAGDIWSHKLEHCLIEEWTETIVRGNRHDLEITFLRLRHYE